MATTPARKLVHWDSNSPAFSDFGSPNFSDISSDSVVSTSSLQYINSQLVAHGFAPAPGICLDGISNSDLERVVKCMLDMLGQRVKDMSRTETLTGELRTLSYNFERVSSMHRTATEKAANFEREMNLHKTRLAAVTRTLQSTEAAHKHTTAELQRTRTSLQSVRATHQSELKKKEKEMERMSEKWSKIADAQTKLMVTPSGMRCANVAVVEGNEILGKGKGFLEIALEQADKARAQLSGENLELRKWLLDAVNGSQTVLHEMKRMLAPPGVNEEEPTPFTLSSLFPLAPAAFANEKLSSVLASLRQSLSALSPATPVTPSPSPKLASSIPDGEVEKLQNIIEKLKTELALSQKQSTAYVAETQAVFDKFADDHRLASGHNAADVSVDLMTVTARDEEKERLDDIKRQLDEERAKFTEAAIRFGKEKAMLEAERMKFSDEKRSWQVEMMLADLPPTPLASSSSAPALARALSPKSPKRSPRKAPHKGSPTKPIAVGKAGAGRKTTRVGRRSSLLASPPISRVEPSYETEVIPSSIPPSLSFEPSLPSNPAPLLGRTTSSSSLLPTSFFLPPPSPHALFPSQPALLLSNPIPASTSTATTAPLSIAPRPAPSDPPQEISPPANPAPAVPITPQAQTAAARRPFPVAKPFAQYMVHAYSPAKPSPLSRILMLANSPASPETHLEALQEEDEAAQMNDQAAESMFPAFDTEPREQGAASGGVKQLTLAQELGVSESPPESPVRPESPLREKKIERNVMTTEKGRMLHSELKAFSAKEKGKGRAEPGPIRPSKAAGTLEKENTGVKKVRTSAPLPAREPVFSKGPMAATVGVAGPSGVGRGTKPLAVKPGTAMTTSRARLMAKLPPPGKGVPTQTGPRRVLKDSAEAPPVGRGRRS